MKYWLYGGIIGLIIFVLTRIVGFYFSSSEIFHDSNLLVTSVIGIFFFVVGSAIGWIVEKIKNN